MKKKKDLLIQLIKWIISGFLYYSRLLTLLEFIGEKIYGRKFIILCYHVVTNTKEGKVDYFKPQMAVSIESFKKQMEFLSKNYNVVPLEELIYNIKENKKLPRKAIAITFDDGYANNYTNAYPILKENNLPATIFLATDYIDTGKLLWFDQVWQILKSYDDLSKIEIPDNICEEDLRVKLLKIFTDNSLERDVCADLVTSLMKKMNEKKRSMLIKYMEERFPPNKQEESLMLSWNQVVEMGTNRISIGAHTKSHPNLPELSEQETEIEIMEGKKEIERRINKKVICFAYPYGNFNDKIKALVTKAGFDCACTTIRGKHRLNSDLFELKRISVTENLTLSFRNRYSKSLFATELGCMFDLLLLRKFRYW